MRLLGISLVAFTLFTIPTTQFMIPIAQGANIKKNVDEYAGKRCNTPAKGSGIVAGYFSGVTDNPIISSDEYVPVDRYRCFKSMEECRGWLYTMESLYGSLPPRATLCKQF